eukprot:m.12199 g.12199  ORF g.12199 m.12199 type:complete len:311 (+) comp5971_c0_seq2:127-1059(+)
MAAGSSDNPILAALGSGELVRVCAPMVRYSKLAFRRLVRRHGVDVAYTPMIISDCFVRSATARDVEFTTMPEDRPLVVQFAANNAEDFAAAVQYVAPYADGVDLNCGCPQRWAMAEGYGSHLLRHPEHVADMVSTATRRVPSVPVSVKIRISDNLQETVEFARRAEHAGAAWVTVHGRTPKQRSQPVNIEAIRVVREALHVPVIANGDVNSIADAAHIRERTGVHGVMSARGLLANPALYDEHATLKGIVKEWVELALETGTPFPCFHHHLMFMLENAFSRSDRRDFNTLSSTAAVIDFLIARGVLEGEP